MKLSFGLTAPKMGVSALLQPDCRGSNWQKITAFGACAISAGLSDKSIFNINININFLIWECPLCCNQIARAAEMSVLAAIGEKLLLLALAQYLLVYHINQCNVEHACTLSTCLLANTCQSPTRPKKLNRGSFSPPKSYVSSLFFG